MQIGLRPVVVEVIYVVRASNSSFEVRWKEETYASGTITRTERFTGIAEIVLKPTNTVQTLTNPLGLFVHAFTWSRDYAK
jgi:type IV secretion system protein TrbF